MDNSKREFDLIIRQIDGESKWVIAMHEEKSIGIGVVEIVEGLYEAALAQMFQFRQLVRQNQAQMPFMRLVWNLETKEADTLFAFDRVAMAECYFMQTRKGSVEHAKS